MSKRKVWTKKGLRSKFYGDYETMKSGKRRLYIKSEKTRKTEAKFDSWQDAKADGWKAE